MEIDKFIKEIEMELSPREVSRAVVRGLNKAAVGIRARVVQDIRQDINIKASDLKETVKITKAKNQAGRVAVELVVKGKPISLIKFVTVASLRQAQAGELDKKGNRRPLRIKVSRKQGAKPSKKGFYVPAYNKIMRRVGKGRGPIREMFGPSLAKMTEAKISQLESFASETVAKRIQESIDFEISKIIKS